MEQQYVKENAKIRIGFTFSLLAILVVFPGEIIGAFIIWFTPVGAAVSVMIVGLVTMVINSKESAMALLPTGMETALSSINKKVQPPDSIK